MRIETEVKLDFCDVLLRPKRSDVPSRKNIQLLRRFDRFMHSPQKLHCIPIISANMDSISTFEMARAMNRNRMLTCLHKFLPVDELVEFFRDEPIDSAGAFYTLGLHEQDWEKIDEVAAQKAYLPRLCLDAANANTKFFVDHVKKLRDWFPEAIIMAGNVACPELVQELLLAGADVAKVGIGPGSVCETRIVTGVGYPQLSAVMECAEAAHGLGGCICSDGGCVYPGDVAKAMGAGADFVMLGGMLAGTMESGTTKFRGMASKEAQEAHYGVKDYSTPEGKSVEVKDTGPVQDVLDRITGGLRSACSYVGARRIKDIAKCATFIRVNRTHNTVFDIKQQGILT